MINLFLSLFNYTKLSLWSVIFFLNFKVYDKINLDLLQILVYNIQTTNSLAVKCIQKLVPYLRMNNTRKEIINILNDVYENNIYHNDIETFSIFQKDFNDYFSNKYLLLERISSGSIGQVYKIQEIESGKIYAMKVIHPYIKYQICFIKILVYLFNLKKYAFFDFDEYIINFINETNFILEANNMKKFYEIYKNNNHIIIPKVKEYSKNIIIMEYCKGENILNLKPYSRNKYIILSLLFCNNNKYIENFNHGDMHLGNYKKYSENKLVVYDFGFCFQVKDTKIVEILELFYLHLIESKLKKIYSYLECMNFILEYNINTKTLKKYEKDVNDMFLTKKFKSMEEFTDTFFKFIFKNKIIINIEFLNLLISSWYTIELNDTSDIEKISYCQVYNIFPEYEEYLKDKIKYTEIKLKNFIEYKNLL